MGPNDLNWYTADADTNTHARTHIHHSFYERQDIKSENYCFSVHKISFDSLTELTQFILCVFLHSLPFSIQHVNFICHLYWWRYIVSVEWSDLNDVVIESMMSFECRRTNIHTIMTYNAWNFQWKCHLNRIDVACALEQCTAWAKNRDDGHNEARQGLQSIINHLLLSIDS